MTPVALNSKHGVVALLLATAYATRKDLVLIKRSSERKKERESALKSHYKENKKYSLSSITPLKKSKTQKKSNEPAKNFIESCSSENSKKTEIVPLNQSCSFQFTPYLENSCWMDTLILAIFSCLSFSNFSVPLEELRGNDLQVKLVDLFRRWSSTGIPPNEADQDFFWKYLRFEKGRMFTLMEFYNRLFPRKIEGGHLAHDKDDPLLPHLGFHLFGLLTKRTTSCTNEKCGRVIEKNCITAIFPLEMDQPCQDVLNSVQAMSSSSECVACKHDVCLVNESVQTTPPFLMFEINEQRIHANAEVKEREIEPFVLVGDERYELICSMHNTGIHFVGYFKFPGMEHVEAGIYRYDNLQSKENAVQVDRFVAEKMPVMLIYKKI